MPSREDASALEAGRDGNVNDEEEEEEEEEDLDAFLAHVLAGSKLSEEEREQLESESSVSALDTTVATAAEAENELDALLADVLGPPSTPAITPGGPGPKFEHKEGGHSATPLKDRWRSLPFQFTQALSQTEPSLDEVLGLIRENEGRVLPGFRGRIWALILGVPVPPSIDGASGHAGPHLPQPDGEDALAALAESARLRCMLGTSGPAPATTGAPPAVDDNIPQALEIRTMLREFCRTTRMEPAECHPGFADLTCILMCQDSGIQVPEVVPLMQALSRVEAIVSPNISAADLGPCLETLVRIHKPHLYEHIAQTLHAADQSLEQVIPQRAFEFGLAGEVGLPGALSLLDALVLDVAKPEPDPRGPLKLYCLLAVVLKAHAALMQSAEPDAMLAVIHEAARSVYSHESALALADHAAALRRSTPITFQDPLAARAAGLQHSGSGVHGTGEAGQAFSNPARSAPKAVAAWFHSASSAALSALAADPDPASSAPAARTSAAPSLADRFKLTMGIGDRSAASIRAKAAPVLLRDTPTPPPSAHPDPGSAHVVRGLRRIDSDDRSALFQVADDDGMGGARAADGGGVGAGAGAYRDDDFARGADDDLDPEAYDMHRRAREESARGHHLLSGLGVGASLRIGDFLNGNWLGEDWNCYFSPLCRVLGSRDVDEEASEVVALVAHARLLLLSLHGAVDLGVIHKLHRRSKEVLTSLLAESSLPVRFNCHVAVLQKVTFAPGSVTNLKLYLPPADSGASADVSNSDPAHIFLVLSHEDVRGFVASLRAATREFTT